jgi:tetratricopeptide (TPR) repeat protein
MLVSRVLAALACLSLADSAVAQDPGLARGMQQVREGDFEAAVTTLEEAARRLEADADRRLEAAQARLQLGIARVALTQLEAAREEFKAALGHDPSLRIGEDRFSPKVVRVFESARQELLARTEPAKTGGSKAPLLVVGALAAVGGGVALAAGGGSGPSPPPQRRRSPTRASRRP